MMDVEIKFLSLPNTGDHAIVIVRGRFDLRTLEMVFTKLEASTERLHGCKILIDLQDAVYNLAPLEIHDFISVMLPDLRLSANKIALVSVAENQQYDRVFMLCALLSNRGFPVSLFCNAREAVRWLAARESSNPIH